MNRDIHMEKETNKMNTFFINDLIILLSICFEQLSVHQEFLTSSFTVFYHAYKQSSRWQDVFDNQTSCQCLDMLKTI